MCQLRMEYTTCLCAISLCKCHSSTVPPRYLSSQYLADSSLSTDVSQFDFSGGPQVGQYEDMHSIRV